MTVPSAINKSGPYTGNGVTTVFPYGFRILDASHIQVVRTEGGIDTIMTTGFTVSGVGIGSGGNVTFAVAPTAAQKITLIRNAPFTQSTDLENQGAYYAETIEDALDLAAMRDQQLAEEVGRAVKVPVGQDIADFAGLISDITRLADSAAQVDTVAAIAADVDVVAGIAADVSLVADLAADVTNFADVYQGPKAIPPTVRNDGSPLQAGDLYFDTVIGGMRVRNASAAWVAALSADALEKSQNLNDLPNKATARANLSIFGIGSQTTTTITNLNTLAIAGEYFAASGATGSPNAEPVLVKHYAADAMTRSVQEVFGLTSGRRWMRVEAAGSWGSWVEIPGGGGITAAMLAAAAIRLSSEGFASPLDTELATALWVDGAIPAKLNAGGSAPVYACRAWVNFNGSGTVTIRASGNVSSITDNGVGDYTLNFATALPDANYALAGMGVGSTATNITGGNSIVLQGSATAYVPNLKTTTQARIQIGNSTNGNLADVQDISVAIFR